MRVLKIEETLSNLEIAHRQIERSIVLYLDDKDFVSALTLAGAAEEILGKLLNEKGKEHWLDGISKGALRALGYRKQELGSSEALKIKKAIANHTNKYKNSLKHYNSDSTVTLFVDSAAAEMINRAISNYFDLTHRETGAMGRFKELIVWGESA